MDGATRKDGLVTATENERERRKEKSDNTIEHVGRIRGIHLYCIPRKCMFAWKGVILDMFNREEEVANSLYFCERNSIVLFTPVCRYVALLNCNWHWIHSHEFRNRRIYTGKKRQSYLFTKNIENTKLYDNLIDLQGVKNTHKQTLSITTDKWEQQAMLRSTMWVIHSVILLFYVVVIAVWRVSPLHNISPFLQECRTLPCEFFAVTQRT